MNIYISKIKTRLILVLFSLFIATQSIAQYNRVDSGDTIPKHYPYILPLMGDAVAKGGVELPLPIGVMLNYFWANQDIDISYLSVGLDTKSKEIPLTDITRLVDFESVKANAVSINIRPDVWVLPFWNVYGVFGKSYTSTDVVLSYPIKLHAIADLNGYSFGLGNTVAFGVWDFFAVLDGNITWSIMDGVDDPIKTRVVSGRLGYTIHLPSKKKRQTNIAFWVGGMSVNFGGITEGSISIKDIYTGDGSSKDEAVSDYYDWYDQLDKLDPRKLIANKVLTPIVEKIDAADGSGTINYRIIKSPKQSWNMIAGGQYQYNDNWQLRFEAGFLGSRSSFLASLNYRFGIKKKEFR